MELTPGTVLDRYVLVAPLGEGGQGEVWRATDPLNPGETRALKLVPVVASRPALLERVRREARALAQLSHPSLVPCHAMFEDLHAGVLGLVLDVAAGASLATVRNDARLTAVHRAELLRHVAGVLAYLHGAGVAHRDVKPENILVSPSFFADPADPRGIKLIDLGIAVSSDDARALTREGAVVGTAPYLAPEAIDPVAWPARGAGGAERDVFAFGVLGWLLLAGAHPTGLPLGASMVQLGKAYWAVHEGKARWPVGAVVGPLAAPLLQAMSPRADARPRDGAALLAGIEAALGPAATRVSAAGGTRTELGPFVPPMAIGRTALDPSAQPLPDGVGGARLALLIVGALGVFVVVALLVVAVASPKAAPVPTVSLPPTARVVAPVHVAPVVENPNPTTVVTSQGCTAPRAPRRRASSRPASGARRGGLASTAPAAIRCRTARGGCGSEARRRAPPNGSARTPPLRSVSWSRRPRSAPVHVRSPTSTASTSTSISRPPSSR